MSDLKTRIEDEIKRINKDLYKPNTALLDIRDKVIKFPYALLSVLEICEENTDHHLVDKNWILKAIERELEEK